AVLRAARGEFRRVVVDVLVADRDPRVVPMLARIVGESEILGKDHEIVLETLAAMGAVGSDQAVPILVTVILRRAVFKRSKLRALKERGVEALLNIGGSKAQAALDEVARTGDGMLKKIVEADGSG